MDEEQYLQKRVEDQISWYDQQSQTNQKCFKRLRLLEIISASIIPFLAGMGENIPHNPVIIGSLGVLIAVSAGVSSLYKFHENWIEYRTTAETLKHEKYLYQTKCSPYNQTEAFSCLVQRVESIISKENSQWSTYVKEKEKHT